MYPVYFDLQVNITHVNRRMHTDNGCFALSLSLSLFASLLFQACSKRECRRVKDLRSRSLMELLWHAKLACGFTSTAGSWCLTPHLSAGVPLPNHIIPLKPFPLQIWSSDDMNIWGLPQQLSRASWVLASLRPSCWTLWTWTQMCCKCVSNVLPVLHIR